MTVTYHAVLSQSEAGLGGLYVVTGDRAYSSYSNCLGKCETWHDSLSGDYVRRYHPQITKCKARKLLKLWGSKLELPK